MDAKWWKSRRGGNSLARAGSPLGPESGVSAADLGVKVSSLGWKPSLSQRWTHTPGPGVRETNRWCWEGSAILGPAAASNQQGESADQ